MAGLKVSQSGIDVSQAADYQLALSTTWDFLKIGFSASFSVKSNTGVNTVFQHNLGYFPAFMIQQANSDGSVHDTGQDLGFVIDRNKLFIDMSGRNDISGYFYIFKHDLTTVINAPIERTTAALSDRSNEVGFAATKDSKKMGSTDLRDYTVSSLGHPLIIHQSGAKTAASGNTGTVPALQLNHGLGYFPVYMIFNDASDGTGVSLIQARVKATAADLSVFGVQSVLARQIYYLIFKDPLFVGE